MVLGPQGPGRVGRRRFISYICPKLTKLRSYIRQYPQVAVLVFIALVLGIGTFIAVLVALATSGSLRTNGEPSGLVAAGRAMALGLRMLEAS